MEIAPIALGSPRPPSTANAPCPHRVAGPLWGGGGAVRTHCRASAAAARPTPQPQPSGQQHEHTHARGHRRCVGRTRGGSTTRHSMPPPSPCDIPSSCCFFMGPWTVTCSSNVASGRCVLSAAAAGALAGVVSAFAEPRRRCAGAVLDVAGCAVCVSAAPNHWRIEDVLVVPPPPPRSPP